MQAIIVQKYKKLLNNLHKLGIFERKVTHNQKNR